MNDEDLTRLPTAKERIVDALDRFQLNWSRMLALDTDDVDRRQSTLNVIHFFIYVTLLETLRQQDEKAADRLAAWLDSMLEDGGAGEIVYEWRSELAEGGGIELPDLEDHR